MYEADFAIEWLDFLEKELYHKGERILKLDREPVYNIQPLDTKIKIGVDLILQTMEEQKLFLMEHLGMVNLKGFLE
jgi:hypothetical protein